MRMKRRTRLETCPNIWRHTPSGYPYAEDTAKGEKFKLACGCTLENWAKTGAGTVAKVVAMHKDPPENRPCPYHGGRVAVCLPLYTVVRLAR